MCIKIYKVAVVHHMRFGGFYIFNYPHIAIIKIFVLSVCESRYTFMYILCIFNTNIEIILLDNEVWNMYAIGLNKNGSNAAI